MSRGRLFASLCSMVFLVNLARVVCALTAVQGVLVIGAVTALLGYVIHSLFPALDTYLLDSLPDENRASAYSLYSGSMMIVQAIGSVALGPLVDAVFAYDAVFRTFGGGLAAILLALVGLYATDRLPKGGEDPSAVVGD